MVRALALCLVVVLVATAGCSGKKSDDGAGSSSSSSPTGPVGNHTAHHNTTTTAPNRAPSADLTATVANGTLPVNVTFNLTGSDPDGDALNWTLAFGDNATANGSALPATVVHPYAASGLYNATFNVTDGNATVERAIVVNVTVAGGGQIVVTASWDAGTGSPGNRYEFTFCEAGPGDGWTTKVFTLPPAAFGKPFVASIRAAQAGSAIQGWGLFLSDPGCGTADTDYDSLSATGTANISGTVGPTWSFGSAYATGGVDLTVTLTIG